MVHDLKVVILAGGKGTRLAPFTSVLPKPLMPVGDQSILEIVLDQLRSHGFRDVVLSVGYLSHLIQAVLEHHAQDRVAGHPSLKLTYVHEHEPLGTAGPLRLVEGLDRTFIVMNGDLLTTLDYSELLRCHHQSGHVLTIAAKVRAIKLDYGVLHTDESINGARRVVKYDEKPEFKSTVSMGIYALEPSVLELIPAAVPFDFPDLVHALLDAGHSVGAYVHDGLWFDIGRHEDYERALVEWPNHMSPSSSDANPAVDSGPRSDPEPGSVPG